MGEARWVTSLLETNSQFGVSISYDQKEHNRQKDKTPNIRRPITRTVYLIGLSRFLQTVPVTQEGNCH